MPGGNPFVSQVSLNGITMLSGSINPNGSVSAPIGSIYVRSSPAQIFQNTDGAMAWGVVGEQTVRWRSFGKIALTTTPTLYDPNGILTGTPTIAEDGTVTWPMGTGQTRNLPSTGACLVLPAPNVIGNATAAYAWLWAILRTELVSGRYTSAPIVYGCVLMDTADPTTARGYGVRGGIETGSTDSIVGRSTASTAGVWIDAVTTSSTGTGAVELTIGRTTSSIRQLSWAACSGSGVTNTGGNTAQVGVSVDFSGGAWLGLWVGTTDTNLIAGSYGTRGLAAITDVDPDDFEGVA